MAIDTTWTIFKSTRQVELATPLLRNIGKEGLSSYLQLEATENG